jgi:hypothetical protein
MFRFSRSHLCPICGQPDGCLVALDGLAAICARREAGAECRGSGRPAGFTDAAGGDVGEGPLLLVKGASDIAALMSIGIAAVGRPGDCGEISLLVDLLRSVAPERRIVVLGERDPKPDGLGPGREVAIRTATRLAEELGRSIAWALPPDEATGARAWLDAMPTMPAKRLTALFVSGLDLVVIRAPPVYTPAIHAGPAVPLGGWRDGMLHDRLGSLRRPGAFLDASVTGAGKSRVDVETILQALEKELAV